MQQQLLLESRKYVYVYLVTTDHIHIHCYSRFMYKELNLCYDQRSNANSLDNDAKRVGQHHNYQMVILIAEGVACHSGHPKGNHQYSLAGIHQPQPRFALIIAFLNCYAVYALRPYHVQSSMLISDKHTSLFALIIAITSKSMSCIKKCNIYSYILFIGYNVTFYVT